MKNYSFLNCLFAALLVLGPTSIALAGSPGTVVLGKTSVTLDATSLSKAITLSLQNAENCDFRILISDRDKKVLKEDVVCKGASFKKRYDLSKLPSGIYLLTFRNADKETVLPIYINRNSLGMEKKNKPDSFATMVKRDDYTKKA